jgi:hypothetical protein
LPSSGVLYSQVNNKEKIIEIGKDKETRDNAKKEER